MAVLIEGYSAVVRIADIKARFPGGWAAFGAIAANAPTCADGDIVSVHFLRTNDLKDFIEVMVALGFVYMREDGNSADIAVVGQETGFIPRCDWLDAGVTKLEGNEVVVARLIGTKERQVVTPQGWTYKGSVSQTGQPVDTNN